MSPDAFEDALETLGWTTGGIARFLNLPRNRVRNWIRRDVTYHIPHAVSAWLLRRVALHEQAMRDDPPPGS